jgi:hypothetical protein
MTIAANGKHDGQKYFYIFQKRAVYFTNSKGKGKVVPFHVMKAYRGSRSIAPLILNLGAKWW